MKKQLRNIKIIYLRFLRLNDLHLWKTNDLSRYREALSKLMEDYDLIDDLKKINQY